LKRAVIFVNGELHNAGRVKACLRADDFLIAADGGHRHLKALGLLPHLVIGDLDSLSDDERLTLITAGIEIKSFPSEKDETDLELALREAVAREFKTILVVAALGGRLDHTLGNLSLLASPFLKDCDVRLEDGSSRTWLMTFERYPGGLEIEGNPGDRVSLVAFHGVAKGIFTKGLKYPLRQEDLLPYQSRGISNVMMETHAMIRILGGQLLVMHSGEKKVMKGVDLK
jgi:thiamine pyrophosphokinase